MAGASQIDRLEVLGHDECLHLLELSAYVGRLAFADEEGPHILPVNYMTHNGSIVFTTTSGNAFDRITDGTKVAFEIDDSHPLDHSGWSVVVQGTTYNITDPIELAALQRSHLKSWARLSAERWVRISLDAVSGRRIPPH